MPIESALVILIPEAEVLVKSFRNRYDPQAALGVSAHVTVLYPFKPPRELTAEVIQTLEEVFVKFPGFSASFAETRRFPGVLYLSPEPVETFRQLTDIITKRFPETPPYGGLFTDVIPHLTVAQVSDPQKLEEVAADFEREAKGRLPIQASVGEIALIDNESGRWQVCTRFGLGTESRAR
jgi:2'-5' RNA ligase